LTASLIHGKQLIFRTNQTSNGRSFEDLEPLEGDYDFPTFTRVEECVTYAASKRVTRENWPIYGDIDQCDVDLTEVSARCARLKSQIEAISQQDIQNNALLSCVTEYLKAGEVFCIL
jgi:hypothetical protein